MSSLTALPVQGLFGMEMQKDFKEEGQETSARKGDKFGLISQGEGPFLASGTAPCSVSSYSGDPPRDTLSPGKINEERFDFTVTSVEVEQSIK